MNFITEKLSLILNRLKLKKKVMLLFLPLNILSVLLILALSVSLIVRNGKEEMLRNSMDKLALVRDQTDRIIENVKYNIKAFSTSSALQDAICADYPDNTYGRYLFSAAMHSSVYNIMDIQSLIEEGYVQTADGQVFHIKNDAIGSPTPAMNKLYKRITEKHGQMVLNTAQDQSGKSALNISKSLIHIPTGQCLGILSFDIREELFYQAYAGALDSEEADGEFFLTDSDGTVISSQDRSLLRKRIPETLRFLTQSAKDSAQDSSLSWNGQRSLALTAPAADGNLHVFYIISYYTVYQEALSLAFLLSAIGLAVLGITVLLSHLLSRSLVRPIIRLAEYADKAGQGSFGAPVPVHSGDEIGFLAARFQRMSHNIQDLTTRIYNEQNQRREYELKLMQAQINPHFLYNCLDSISSLVADRRNDDAGSMLYHLGRYYRSVLSKGRNRITIREELHMIRDYLEIQLIKTPGLFTYEICCEEELKELKILKMLLQPLVENSVLHGFYGFREKGHIKVEAVSDGQAVVFTVSDNGRGIPGELLSSLSENETASIPRHFGLSNVRERIRLKYGPAFGLTICSMVGEGTLINVRLPRIY